MNIADDSYYIVYETIILHMELVLRLVGHDKKLSGRNKLINEKSFIF